LFGGLDKEKDEKKASLFSKPDSAKDTKTTSLFENKDEKKTTSLFSSLKKDSAEAKGAVEKKAEDSQDSSKPHSSLISQNYQKKEDNPFLNKQESKPINLFAS